MSRVTLGVTSSIPTMWTQYELKWDNSSPCMYIYQGMPCHTCDTKELVHWYAVSERDIWDQFYAHMSLDKVHTGILAYHQYESSCEPNNSMIKSLLKSNCYDKFLLYSYWYYLQNTYINNIYYKVWSSKVKKSLLTGQNASSNKYKIIQYLLPLFLHKVSSFYLHCIHNMY